LTNKKSFFSIEFTLNSSVTEVYFTTPRELITLIGQSDRQQVLIFDRKVFDLYQDLFQVYLVNTPYYFIDAREEEKKYPALIDLIEFLTINKFTRSTEIIAIGGGITLDLTAFAASIYKRGTSLTFVPTSFVAMIDASIGGKTGINYNNYKNLLGSFYPASRVLINRDFLKTLSPVDIMNGWAECIKASLLTQNKLYEMIMNGNQIITKELILEAINIKAALCGKDLTDLGARQKLNLGHTYAHVIESISDYQIPHGMAVAIGIRAAAKHSLDIGLINDIIFNRIVQPLNKFKFPQKLDKKYHQKLLSRGKDLLEMDKKNRQLGQLVLFSGFQRTTLQSCKNFYQLIKNLLEL